MAAPIGNQFWKLRSKHGRNRLFESPELLLEAANEYFEWCDAHPYKKPEQKKGNTIIPKNFEGDINDLGNVIDIEVPRPYTIQALCLYLDCGTNYFSQFEESLKGKDDEKSKDFSCVLTRIRETIQSQQTEGGMMGTFNPMITARLLGLKEKQDITSNDKEIQGIASITITREDYKALSNDIDKQI